MNQTASLSVIIPALNAERLLRDTLRIVTAAHPAEIVVVDGGSEDRTRSVAADNGARVVTARRGRGPQLAAGAAAASGDWLLFLHADTRLSGAWMSSVRWFMAQSRNETRAGVFRFALDDRAPQARRIERLVAWRTRVLGLPYGDQGLLISRRLYDRLGGYRPLPLMEDVDLVRRIGRSRLTILDGVAVTSAARYRRDGWWLRPARNLLCLVLYFLRFPPGLIYRIYQ